MESNELKLRANSLFGSMQYSEAIQEYDRALQSCPNYLDFEIAVVRSNIAACHLKLEDWKAAVTAATSSIESLERLDPQRAEGETTNAEEDMKETDNDGATNKSSPSATDVQRIKVKSLMRRAKARCELSGWAALQGAEEGKQTPKPANPLPVVPLTLQNLDYKLLSKMDNLSPADRKTVQSQLLSLPPRLDAAKEAEIGQMMGKLKEVCLLC
jgi:hypothetical protein